VLTARYSRASPITVDLVRLETSQRALPGIDQFDRPKTAASWAQSMTATRDGAGAPSCLPPLASPKSRSWSTKFGMRSPRYTMCIDELPAVGAFGAGAQSLDERLSKGGAPVKTIALAR
jgi:hypothetical protein